MMSIVSKEHDSKDIYDDGDVKDCNGGDNDDSW